MTGIVTLPGRYQHSYYHHFTGYRGGEQHRQFKQIKRGFPHPPVLLNVCSFLLNPGLIILFCSVLISLCLGLICSVLFLFLNRSVVSNVYFYCWFSKIEFLFSLSFDPHSLFNISGQSVILQFEFGQPTHMYSGHHSYN